jgi:hypothetical protein
MSWLCKLVTRRKWLALLMLAMPLYPSLTFLDDYGYAPFVPLIICILLEFGKSDLFGFPEASVHAWTMRACLALSLVYAYVLILYSLIAVDNYRLSVDSSGLKSYVEMIASKSRNLDRSSLVTYSGVITPCLVALSDFNLDPITLTPRSVNSEPLGAGFSPASVAAKEIGWIKQIEGTLKKKIVIILFSKCTPLSLPIFHLLSCLEIMSLTLFPALGKPGIPFFTVFPCLNQPQLAMQSPFTSVASGHR